MIGQEIKKFRTTNRISQLEMANILGYSNVSTLSRIESGTQNISSSVYILFKLVKNNPELAALCYLHYKSSQIS